MNHTTTTTMNYTHTTYAAAMEQLKRNKRNKVTTMVSWDAGSGYTSEGYYCQSQKRIVLQQRKGDVYVIG
jgi:hypothetical protein